MISYPEAHDLGMMVVTVISILLVVGIPCYLYFWVRSKLQPEWLNEPMSDEEMRRVWDEIEASRARRR